MTRPELWAMIDAVALVHPPGGPLRLTNAELEQYLWYVSTSLLASSDTKRLAKKAAALVPKMIGPVYELPTPSRPLTPPAERANPRPGLFDHLEESQ